MKQLSALDKKRLGRPLVDSAAKRRVKRLLYPAALMLAKRRIKYKVVVHSSCNPVPGKPIIYAQNHGEISDSPIICSNIDTDCYVLAGKQSLDLAGSLFFAARGVIYFDRADKAEMAAAKEEICAYLNEGIGIIWAPEGTWNLTDSLPMLPMRWGIIDVARETGAQIIPFVMNYDRENMVCRVDWGAPIHGDALNDKAQAINRLRDCMATFRWEAWSAAPPLRRAEIDVTAMRAAIMDPVREYPQLDLRAEQAAIFHPHTDPAEAFAHLTAIEPNSRTAFLFNKRLTGI